MTDELPRMVPEMAGTALSALSAKVRFRLMNADDMRALAPVLREPEAWFGMVAERAGQCVGLGTLLWLRPLALGGRLVAWATLDAFGPLPAHTVCRLIRAKLAHFGRLGELAVYAFCNQAFPNAERLLRMFGFHPSAELPADPQFGRPREFPPGLAAAAATGLHRAEGVA